MHPAPLAFGSRRLLAALVLTSFAAAHCASPSASEEETNEAVAPEALLTEPSLAFGTWRSTACETVDAAKRFLEARRDLPTHLRRGLVERVAETERALLVRATTR